MVGVRKLQGEYRETNWGRNISLMAYAKDVIVLGETEQDVQKVTESLVGRARKLGLFISESKTETRTERLTAEKRVVSCNNLLIHGPEVGVFPGRFHRNKCWSDPVRGSRVKK